MSLASKSELHLSFFAFLLPDYYFPNTWVYTERQKNIGMRVLYIGQLVMMLCNSYKQKAGRRCNWNSVQEYLF